MKPQSFLACALVLSFVGGLSYPIMGQEKNGDKGEAKAPEQLVERKTNQFNNKTTVTLAQRRILDRQSPRQIVEMKAETTFAGATPTGVTDMVMLVFTTAAEKNSYVEPIELNFIVDSRQVKGGRARIGVPYNPKVQLAPDLKVACDIRALISPDTLRTIGHGKTVKMQLGTIELTMDESTVSNLSKFSSAVFNK